MGLTIVVPMLPPDPGGSSATLDSLSGWMYLANLMTTKHRMPHVLTLAR